MRRERTSDAARSAPDGKLHTKPRRGARLAPVEPVAALAVLAVLAVLLASCAGTGGTGTAAQRVRAWASAAGVPGSTRALRADAARVSAAAAAAGRAPAGSAKARVVQFDCYTLQFEAEKANGELPAPDQALSAALASAYKGYYTYATGCVRGGGTASSLSRWSSYRAGADRELARAMARLGALQAAAPPVRKSG